MVSRTDILKVAIQGELGSNSHMAAREMMGEVEIVACAASAEVLARVASGEATCAVLPIENSLHGVCCESVTISLRCRG
jgi:prephenate dehydratase